MTETPDLEFLDTPGGAVAYRKSAGASPAVVFCGGFMSDMTGTKAVALEAHCRSKGQAFIRFDYRGHGETPGAFAEHVISDWLADTLAVLDALVEDHCVLIGSSMGGWIAMHAALARPQKVSSLILIAPAPDFTQRLMEPGFTDDERAAMAKDGYIAQPTDYGDDPYIITRALVDDGKALGLLHRPVAIRCPVRILHGQRDTSVPWDLSLEIADKLETPDVVTTFIKDGDHRLSEPGDIARLLAAVDGLS